jgi:hypothetical protein
VTIDLASMLVVAVIVCAACGIFYALDSARTLAGRHMAAWMSGFATTLLSAVSYLAATLNGDSVWIVAIANASMVAAIAALWVGCRLFNGRRSLVLLGTLVVGVTALSAVLDPTDDPEWAGTIARLGSLIVLSLLVVFEARRGRMRTASASLVLVIVLSLHAAFTAVRLVVYIWAGPHSEAFERIFGTAFVTYLNLVFVILVAVSLVLLRSWERKERLASEREGIRTVGRRAFEVEATALRTTLESGERLAVVEVAIDGYGDLRRAYGLASAGELEALLAEAVFRELPSGAVCTRVRGGIVLVAMAVEDGPVGVAGLRDLAAGIAAGYREAVVVHLDGFAGAAKLGAAIDPEPPLPVARLTAVARSARGEAERRGELLRLAHTESESLDR